MADQGWKGGPEAGSGRTAGRLDGITVLCVEDCEDVRRPVTALLRRAGAHVLECASATEALALEGHGSQYHALLTDYDLQEEWSGADLARHLCARQPRLGVTVLSGMVDDALMSRVRKEWRVMSKPADAKELVEAIAGSVGLI